MRNSLHVVVVVLCFQSVCILRLERNDQTIEQYTNQFLLFRLLVINKEVYLLFFHKCECTNTIKMKLGTSYCNMRRFVLIFFLTTRLNTDGQPFDGDGFTESPLPNISLSNSTSTVSNVININDTSLISPDNATTSNNASTVENIFVGSNVTILVDNSTTTTTPSILLNISNISLPGPGESLVLTTDGSQQSIQNPIGSIGNSTAGERN